MSLEKILIVDDEELIRSFLKVALTKAGYFVELASDGKEALTHLRKENFDLLLTDMKMEGMGGIELLKKVKEEFPSLLVIVMTAFGTVESAVEAMRIGAFHYILKPFTVDTIEAILEKAKDHLALAYENAFYREEKSAKTQTKVIAESPPMKALFEELSKIAKTSASIFLTGETGTGKEIVSRYIHASSLRSSAPFISVNCAAIPETLLESEFFGHEKGAFTSALSKKMGRFELADKGTLFLDEVTEIPLALQPKLLRAIQEKQFERVGGIKTLSVDIRFIAASNRNLKEAIKEKIFREDLYFRLNVIPIHLLPLRERREDILPLADYFIEKFVSQYHKKQKTLSHAAKKKLLDYPWPGNVRELANVVERAIVLSDERELDSELFNLEIFSTSKL